MRRLVLAPLAGLLAALSLAACTSSAPDPAAGARALADHLATGLARKSLTGVPVDTTVDLTTTLGGLAGVPVTVDVDGVDTRSNAATATLTWAWTLADGHRWTYRTDADLVRTGTRWSVRWAPDVVEPSLRTGETLALATRPATRGRILGADGVALVRPRPVVHYGLDKSRVRPAQQPASARRVARALGLDVPAYVRAVARAGARQFVEGIVLRRGDTGRVPASYSAIPGAGAVAGTLPLGPTKGFAAPILGSVGPATAEIVAAAKGAVRAGDVVGLSGLQLRYDAQLRGTPGREVEAVDGKGATRSLFSYPAVAGRPLTLTLDQALQLKAERVLAGVGATNASAIVALRPSTGAILAAANGSGAHGQDVATYGRYAPGSTFKVVSSLALLRRGVTPATRVDCPPTTVVDGKTFKNYSDYPSSALGSITFETAIANSCNTAVIGQRGRLSGDDLSAAAAALGVGVDHDTGFPSYFGQVPAAASETEAAADMIGQGKVLASPMTMATVAASVEAGHTVVPYLVDGRRPTATPAHPLTATEAGQLRTLMRAVVTQGSGRLLDGLSGPVGAKTGTAEYGTAKGGSLPTHAWMIAYRGDLAVAVFVATGSTGSGTAGPLLLRFLS